MKTREQLSSCLVLLMFVAGAMAKEHRIEPARITVQTLAPGCRVELDAVTVGTTDSSGKLRLASVDPGDHYLHVDCVGTAETAYFVTAKAGEEARIGPPNDAPPVPAPTALAIQTENKAKLQQLVQKAIQLRNQAQLDEAVAALRQAMTLDPENSDLHREMGITFLLAKEWKRARVEMIEAIRHDQTDADAHNGLGYALEKLGDLDAALKEYRIATRLEPDDSSYSTHYFETQMKIQARQDAKK